MTYITAKTWNAYYVQGTTETWSSFIITMASLLPVRKLGAKEVKWLVKGLRPPAQRARIQTNNTAITELALVYVANCSFMNLTQSPMWGTQWRDKSSSGFEPLPVCKEWLWVACERPGWMPIFFIIPRKWKDVQSGY